MNADLPKMPEGYYHLQASDGCYVLMDAVITMKRLQSKGRDKRFSSTEEAAEYAHKHKAADLTFDQEAEP